MEELCQKRQGYIFLESTQVVGVFLFTKLVQTLTIIKLAVLPNFTRQGIASRLLEQNMSNLFACKSVKWFCGRVVQKEWI